MGTRWPVILVVLMIGCLSLAIPRRDLPEKENGRNEDTNDSTQPEPAEANQPSSQVTNSSQLENDLLTAVEHANISAIQNLTKLGVNINFNNGIPLNYAVTSANIEMVRALIQAGADVNVNQGTLLKNAAWGGHQGIVEEFLKAGAKKEYFGSALAEAANKGHSQIVQLLLDNGADPSKAESALKFAAENGNVDTVRLLLRSGTNASSDETGGSALFRAVMEGHSEIVTMLVENGADVNKALTSNYWWDDFGSTHTESYGEGWTVMHATARFGQPLVELLVELGADINVKDVKGYTPLQIALIHKKFGVAQELLRFCANITTKNNEGTVALDLAKKAEDQVLTNTTQLRPLMDKMTQEIPDQIAAATFSDHGIEELKNAFERKLSSEPSLKGEVKGLFNSSVDIVKAAEKLLEQKASKEIVQDLEERTCTEDEVRREVAKCKCTPPTSNTTSTVREEKAMNDDETTSSTSSPTSTSTDGTSISTTSSPTSTTTSSSGSSTTTTSSSGSSTTTTSSSGSSTTTTSSPASTTTSTNGTSTTTTSTTTVRPRSDS